MLRTLFGRDRGTSAQSGSADVALFGATPAAFATAHDGQDALARVSIAQDATTHHDSQSTRHQEAVAIGAEVGGQQVHAQGSASIAAHEDPGAAPQPQPQSATSVAAPQETAAPPGAGAPTPAPSPEQQPSTQQQAQQTETHSSAEASASTGQHDAQAGVILQTSTPAVPELLDAVRANTEALGLALQTIAGQVGTTGQALAVQTEQAIQSLTATIDGLASQALASTADTVSHIGQLAGHTVDGIDDLLSHTELGVGATIGLDAALTIGDTTIGHANTISVATDVVHDLALPISGSDVAGGFATLAGLLDHGDAFEVRDVASGTTLLSSIFAPGGDPLDVSGLGTAHDPVDTADLDLGAVPGLLGIDHDAGAALSNLFDPHHHG